MNTTRQRKVPAVAAAFIAAGGTIWYIENYVRQDDGDHLLRGEIHTTSTATMVFVVNSAWRGELASVSTGVSAFHAHDVWVLEGEPVEAVLLGKQTSGDTRQRVECVIRFDNAVVSRKPATVRLGDQETVVKCAY